MKLLRFLDVFKFWGLYIEKEKKVFCFEYGFEYINYDFLKIYFVIIVYKMCVLYYLKWSNILIFMK